MSDVACSIKNGIVIVASDMHYWPGPKSMMHKALCKFCKDISPQAFIANGDIVDMAAVSRHPPIGWENVPTVKQEIEVAQDRLHEISMTLKRGAKLIWNLGNHDSRFETRLATAAPEYAKLHGIHLKDHFPEWENAWATWINKDVVIKHRFRSGIHAPWNNVVNAGISIVTGHLHSAKVTPMTDYRGTRYGVDTGCIADTNHESFVNYSEGNPKNWRSAFGVLTFVDGNLLFPELVTKYDDKHVQFRGKLIAV